MLIFDAHLDLSLNAIEFNRDLRQSLDEIRNAEAGLDDHKARSANTVTFSEMRKAGIGICVATQIAGCMKPRTSVAVWESPEQAWAMTQGQLAWYRAMEDVGEMKMIRTSGELLKHQQAWNDDPKNTPIGYILSLEGADSMRTLSDLESAWNNGLRAMGPAHYGIGRYALGHDQTGPLSDEKMTSVSSVMLASSKAAVTRPIMWSTIIVNSPYMPAPLLPRNSSAGSHGVCGAG